MRKVQPFSLIVNQKKFYRHEPVEMKESLIPMVDMYQADNFYIRDCYEEYYEGILQLLDSGSRVVTVTGTPGIGKSMFYYFFFERFRNEFPDMTVLTAAFNKHGVLIKCKVFSKAAPLGIEYASIPNIEEPCIYLYDGAPDSPPSGKDMVCFTRRNLDWDNEMIKHGRHQCIYMGPWSWEEMLDAVNQLGLAPTITRDILDERYEFFGGVARPCFSLDIGDAIDECVEATKSVKSYKDILDCFHQSRETFDVAHKILQCIPTSGFEDGKIPSAYTLEFRSRNVQQLVMEIVSADEQFRRTHLT